MIYVCGMFREPGCDVPAVLTSQISVFVPQVILTCLNLKHAASELCLYFLDSDPEIDLEQIPSYDKFYTMVMIERNMQQIKHTSWGKIWVL